jgi:hypothetical protein
LIQINPRRILGIAYWPYGTRDRVRVAMSSLDIAASPPIRRDETVRIALLLAFVGGYLDAYTRITDGAVVSGGNQLGSLRRCGIFVGLCAAFGIGAAIGALATRGFHISRSAFPWSRY